MCVVLVVDDVLQVDARLLLQVQEELLVEDEGHARDLLHRGLGVGVPVDEVGRDGDGQLASELFPLETCTEPGKCVVTAKNNGQTDR